MDKDKKNKSNMRIDEILIWDGLITEAQLKEALKSQKEYHGKIGSNLMRHGFIDEAGLVNALAKQFDAEGVILSDLDIPCEVIKMIPKKVAVARRIIPFDYNPDSNTLKIACENPLDDDLMNELNFVARGKEIKLYIAVELAIKTAIARYYMTQEKPEEPENLVESGDFETSGENQSNDFPGEPEERRYLGHVMLVTDDPEEAKAIKTILENEFYCLHVHDSADVAIENLGDREYCTVFIKDTVSGDYLDLIDRLRKLSAKTKVRYYESAGKLLMEQESFRTASDLIIRNLDLFTSLMSSRDKLPDNHSGIVGDYVNRLCLEMGIPDKERISVVNAAYLHDMAKFYYGNTDNMESPRALIELTSKLIDSLNFPPLIVEILRSMYINLRQKYTKRLPIEVLGGNIVTAVDIYCDSITPNEKLSLDKFDAIKRKFSDLTGKLFLNEVAEVFINMIQEEVFDSATDDKYNQVMIYSDTSEFATHVELRLKQEKFRTISVSSVDSFVELFKRSEPEIMIFIKLGEPPEVLDFVSELIDRGVNIKKVPCFLLVDSSVISELTSLLEKGIEDIIPVNDNPNLLIVKMKKIQMLITERENGNKELMQENGARGRLEDMNLIDLLQAMGPSRKTVRMAVSNDGKELVIYLNHGEIVYAKCDDKEGAEAVYEGLAWNDGTWSVQPVSENSIPEPNNSMPNESILMEGCRLLDEREREGNNTEKIPLG